MGKRHMSTSFSVEKVRRFWMAAWAAASARMSVSKSARHVRLMLAQTASNTSVAHPDERYVDAQGIQNRWLADWHLWLVVPSVVLALIESLVVCCSVTIHRRQGRNTKNVILLRTPADG